MTGLRAVCDCPVGHNCKHSAAALIAMATREATPGAPDPPARLPPILEAWLDRVRTADAPEPVRPEAGADGYPDNVRDRLIYVVDVTASGSPAVTPMKASLRKDGTLSRTARRFDASRLAWQETPKFLRAEDLRILRRIDFLGLNRSVYAASRGVPEPGEVTEALGQIAATGRGRLGEVSGPALATGGARTGRLTWVAEPDGRQKLRVTDGDDRKLIVVASHPPAYVDPATGAFGPLSFEIPAKLALAVLAAPDIPPEAAETVADALEQLGAGMPAPNRIRTATRTGIQPTPVLRLFALHARTRPRWKKPAVPVTLPALRLAFDYDGHCVATSSPHDPKFRDGDTIVTLRRDRKFEDGAFDLIEERGPLPIDYLDMNFGRDAEGRDLAFAEDATPGMFEGASDAMAFTADTVPQLRADGWRVEIDPSWPYRLHEGPVQLRAALEQGGGDWFSLGLTLEAGGQRIDLAPLVGSIVAALPLDADGAPEAGFDLDEFLEDVTVYQRLADGTHVALRAAELAPLVNAVRGLLDGFHRAEAGRLPELAEALDGCGVPFEGRAALIELGRKLRALTAAPMAEPPAALAAELRPYQKTGYGWLSALAETGFGGVLADDMGLGKTVQTLALLVERHLARGADRPSLLIVPTSLVGTWRREAERFAPELRVLVLHGPDRHALFDRIPAHHLVITTYPLVHRDHAKLFAQDWELAVLDEAQAVKNPASSGAKHIRAVRARTRLALTGTPMENSLLDLWTLFDWLIPGLLGDRKAFTNRFRTPIEKLGDAAAQAALNARVRPFLLRRTKADVAADLPEKTEITELVPLGDPQRGLYESIRVTMDARVRDAIAAKGLAASRITILDALLKLRQVCCDPELVRQAGAKPVSDSAKRERLIEMLEQLIAEGRRVLVFSQFVAMLRLIEADVKARGWDYAWLTGESRNREEVISGFQEGQAPLFLISLKAGGVGLTLTAADTVILYDPWWNPAVERQAMDRVHRIGQDRAVFVYRLVAEGSVEQAIAALQARKQALADALFEGSNEGPLALTEADLASLFQPIGA
ncbi:DEAD/DEAH box helicase [Amaricoccus sp.]|uniref:DEAD/DEAH box helicase n=1 Tax=Amaricoccus sp. TaxID=1872485 RepID=UPI001B5C456F|nr:DEAD/DEAH box helicase [Amaricoccus sp.]MBP7240817.1 DEAD/DEAH box helicase [Amaricoccus sp.]